MRSLSAYPKLKPVTVWNQRNDGKQGAVHTALDAKIINIRGNTHEKAIDDSEPGASDAFEHRM